MIYLRYAKCGLHLFCFKCFSKFKLMKKEMYKNASYPISVLLMAFVIALGSCSDSDSEEMEEEFVFPPIMYPAQYDAVAGEATLTWDPVENAQGYMVYYTDDDTATPDEYALLSEDPYSSTSTVDATIPVGTTRIYMIKAVTGNGESEFSEPIILSVNNTGNDLIDNIWFDMVEVEGGTFTMGGYKSDEQPHHDVTLSSFRMMKFELTQEIFEALGYTNPSKEPTDPKAPVNQVRWILARDFVNKLNGMTNMNFRLPTEAEWEYAARGGQLDEDGDFPGFNDPAVIDEYVHRIASGEPTKVGTKKPNELGLYDMAGNVAEWCADYFDPEYYTADPVTNPKGPSAPTSSDSLRVMRGGGANHETVSEETFLMVHERSSRAQQSSHNALGFRLVHSIR